MPHFSEIRTLPYDAKQILDLILDIKKYPEFLPWCSGARIIETNEEYVIADLIIHYKIFNEKYRSKVISKNIPGGYEITVDLVDGPFSRLVNNWKLYDQDNGTKVEFFIDFKFKSMILEKMIGLLFEQAAKKMISAFENRAKEIYGKEISKS